MTDEEREWLSRLGFEQSAFTKTRWINGDSTAWLDLAPAGWFLTTWADKESTRTCRDTLGLELVPMLAFAMAEGWL